MANKIHHSSVFVATSWREGENRGVVCDAACVKLMLRVSIYWFKGWKVEEIEDLIAIFIFFRLFGELFRMPNEYTLTCLRSSSYWRRVWGEKCWRILMEMTPLNHSVISKCQSSFFAGIGAHTIFTTQWKTRNIILALPPWSEKSHKWIDFHEDGTHFHSGSPFYCFNPSHTTHTNILEYLATYVYGDLKLLTPVEM